MRIDALQLEAFGPFQGSTIDFSPGQQGVHLVYGPNEAGKSSTLRAIYAALFGFEKGTPDAFVFDYKNLRVGLSLQNLAGDRLRFRRRKGNKDTLLAADAEQALDDHVLAPFLHGINKEEFIKIHAIDHEQMVDGGKTLLALRGLVGESLFAASLGGPELISLQDSLDQEAAGLYVRRGKSRIGEAIKQAESLRKQRDQLTVSQAAWFKVRKEVADAAQRVRKLDESLRELEAQRVAAQRILHALPLIGKRMRLREQLQSVADAHVLPACYLVDQRQQCEIELREVRQQLRQMHAQLDGETGLRRRINEMSVAEGLLELAAPIESLGQRLGEIKKAIRDRDTHLFPSRDALRANILRARRDLKLGDLKLGDRKLGDRKLPERTRQQGTPKQGTPTEGTPDETSSSRETISDHGPGAWAEPAPPGGTVGDGLRGSAGSHVADEDLWRDALESYRLSPDQQVQLQRMATEEPRARAAPLDLAAQLREASTSRAQLERELAGLGEPADTQRVRTAYEQARKYDDLEDRLGAADAEIARLQEESAAGLRRVGLWEGTPDQLRQVAWPLWETIEQFERRWQQQQQLLDAIARDREAVEHQLRDALEQIQRLEKRESVPTEEQLRQLRQLREQRWQDLRTRWLQAIYICASPDSGPQELASSSASVPDSDIRQQELAGGSAGLSAPSGKGLPAEGAVSDEIRKLADNFERTVQEADQLADRLRREADSVARLAGHHEQVALLQQRHEELTARHVTEQDQRSRLQDRWRQEWAAAGITEPRGPREMREWLTRVERLRDQIGRLHELQRERKRLVDQHQTLCAELVAGLRGTVSSSQTSAVVLDRPGGPATMAELLHQAESWLAEQDNRNRHRENLGRDRDRVTRERERLQAELDDAQRDWRAWLARWLRAISPLGFSREHTTGEQVLSRAELLRQLFEQLDGLADIESRLAGIAEDVDAFQRDVQVVVRQAAVDLDASNAILAIEALLVRVREARLQQARRTELSTQLENECRQLELAEHRERELAARLAEFCDWGGVTEPEALAAIEALDASRRRWLAELQDVEEQLQMAAGAADVATLVAEAREQAHDTLVAKIAELSRQLDDLQQVRDEARDQWTECRRHAAQVDGSYAAAAADQQFLETVTGLQRDLRRYARLRVASTILRQQVEAHRSAHQDPLLARASDFFSRMTLGEFQRIEADTDRGVLVAVRTSTALRIDVAGMSTGTRDQLFMALRMAYLENLTRNREPLPFIVDDVLIHFDDQRALATLEVLSELSRTMQVIIFTHHRRIVELAGEELDPSLVFLTQLHWRNTADTAARRLA